ncbi:Clp protease N-terminal domain-containing protein [Actinocrispum wychmicini]|uniref:ClpA/ClpB-like protein n=1 Tax=Actinocrispum wychmicini TaxID=1213861 RepID=A0A4R2JAX4_9PSEU|nr:Clp protease N-terminal domain-containing protein [Actinocrispum wychmicini]TCO56611.1 ClpA/ClpB-like protein [Actinocrispum wychmicini]
MRNTPRLGDLIDVIDGLHPNGDPLKKLSDAVHLAQHMNELADHLIGHFVDRARHSGASWTEIGQNMGVTKQAAQKRFTSNAPEQLDLSQFARFTNYAREATVAAQGEARTGGQATIEPGHILLGLLHQPEALAAKAMATLGASPEAVRAAVTAKLGPPAENPPGEHIPFSGASKKVLELTVREALRLGHNHVGTEHILLGLLALGTNVAGPDALAALDITTPRVEAEISVHIAKHSPEREPAEKQESSA